MYKVWARSTGGMKLTGRNRKCREKNQSRSHYFHHLSHVDWPRIRTQASLGQRPATKRLSHGTAQIKFHKNISRMG